MTTIVPVRDHILTPNGSVIFGSRPALNPAAAITPAVIADGDTLLSEPFEIPAGYHYMSLELHVAPQAGSGTVTVKLRSANAKATGALVDRGVTSPTAFASTSAAQSAVITHDPDSNWFQLEMAASGATFNVSAIATVK